MLRLLRIALQVVLFFLLLSTVVGVASVGTGVAEKVVPAGLAVGLACLAPWVRRIGVPRSA